MTGLVGLDRKRIQQLFDLRRRGDSRAGGASVYTTDPYPALHRLRESGPVHEGVVHELLGYDQPAWFQGLPYPDRPHSSVFSFELCDRVFRDEHAFRSAPGPVLADAGQGLDSSMLAMNGRQHRRYRALVQPSFVPAKAEWWIAQWIHKTVHSLIDGFEADGR